MFALFHEISWRRWINSPLRALLVVLGIALGVALYVATQAAGASMQAAFSDFVTRVSGRADLNVQGSGTSVPYELVAAVAEVPGVAHAAPTLELSAQAPDLGESLFVLGIDFLGDLELLPFKTDERDESVLKDPLAFINDPTAILVSQRFATRHGLSRGSKLRLLTADGIKDFHVRGLLDDRGTGSSFGGQLAVMFLDAAQISFARGTMVDRIDIGVAPGADVAAVRERVQAVVGSEFEVARPEQIGMRLTELSAPLLSGLRLSGFLALIVGAFLVYNAVGIAVVQRTREIGLLRALGVTRRATTLMFCGEAAILAIPGILLGLALGRLLSTYSAANALTVFNQLYGSLQTLEPRLDSDLALTAAGSGLLMALVAAWWPARRAASVEPASVLHAAPAVQRKPIRVFKLLGIGLALVVLAWIPLQRPHGITHWIAVIMITSGAALCTPSVIMLLRRMLLPLAEVAFGLPVRLGFDYVERTLERSTINVLALMVTVAISVSVAGWMGSFERTIKSSIEQVGITDLSVTRGSPVVDRRQVPMNPDVIARVAHLPGIERVQSFRLLKQNVAGQVLYLLATETDTFLEQAARRKGGWRIVDGEEIHAGELVARPLIVLSVGEAKKLGKKVGDELTLSTPKGPKSFQVRATVVDTGNGYIDRKYLIEYWGNDAVDMIGVYLEPGANSDLVAGQIQRELGGSSVFVTTTAAARQQLLDYLKQTFSYSRTVELVTLLIAMLGIAGTMAAAVMDRVREIAMLRAVGATRRQVALSIVVEAAFLGFCASVAGIALGSVEYLLFLDLLMSKQMAWHLDFVFPWEATLRVSGLVVVTSAIAGGVPAFRAARADVVAGVAGE